MKLLEEREVEKPAYLLHKAETYMEDAAELAKQDPEDFLEVMNSQVIGAWRLKEQIEEEFRENFKDHFCDRGGAAYEVGSGKAPPQADEVATKPSPTTTPKSVDLMVKNAISKAVAQVSGVDKGR